MILVTGATGFIGQHLVRGLVAAGHPVRCLVRRDPRRGVLPEWDVELAVGDVVANRGLREACEGVDAVVHLVGIISEHGSVSFERVHVGGTLHIVEAARAARVAHMIYLSGLGAGPRAASAYHRTKWQAEEACRHSGLPWTVVRSSVVIGRGDGFTPILAGLLRKGPVVPVAGSGRAKLQPIYVGDLVRCLMWCLEHEGARDQTYEVGGPQQLSLNRMLTTVARIKGVHKPRLHIPLTAMYFVALAQEALLSRPEVTRDQLKMLAADNTCDPDGLRDVFGIEPVPYEEAVREALKE